VLDAFGARALPTERGARGCLGSFDGVAADGRAQRTLVWVDAPRAVTGALALAAATSLRASMPGAWDRVIVLGWRFAPTIARDLRALRDPRLSALLIPPDLLDHPRATGDGRRGRARFASLRELRLHPVECESDGVRDVLSVRLEQYALLTPDAVDLDDGDRSKLARSIESDPFALLAQWSVDPAYDGAAFRAAWRCERAIARRVSARRSNDGLRMVDHVQLRVPVVEGRRTVCVRSVDILGFEAEAIATLPALCAVTA
jgi:adenine-specific DNA-methyltransferase